jgi:threonine dehydrogenase-like Zn-dependent dehydrogenase
VRKGGTVSIVGVYGPDLQRRADRQRAEQGPDAAHEPGQREAPPAAPDRAHPGRALKPSEIITHRIPLEDVADAYHIFSSKLDNCIKPVLIPPSARH